jgi:hypothetical protein
MLIPPYPFSIERDLVGDLDKMTKKLRKERRAQYPERISPYAVDINDSYAVFGAGPRDLFGSYGRPIQSDIPLVGGTQPVVETEPPTPGFETPFVGMPEVESALETRGRVSPGELEGHEEKAYKDEMTRLIDVETGTLKSIERIKQKKAATPSSKQRQKKQLKDYNQILDQTRAEMAELQKGFNVKTKAKALDVESIGKKLDPLKFAQEELAKVKAEKEGLEAGEAAKKTATANQLLVDARMGQFFGPGVDGARYHYFNLDTGQVRQLDTKKEVAGAAVGVGNTLKHDQINPYRSDDPNNPNGFIVFKPSSAYAHQPMVRQYVTETLRRLGRIQ